MQSAVNPLFICASDDVAVGVAKPVKVGDENVVVWRDTTGDAHVWSDRCPHRGMELSSGVVDGCLLQCAHHGWRFDVNGQLVIPLHTSQVQRTPAFVRAYETTERDGGIYAEIAV